MCSLISCAQAGMPNFEVMLEDAAPGEIQAIFQDKNGYMWFGARNALLRYNAYTFQEIRVLEQKGQEVKKISPYFVTDIFEDSAGTLWISSLGGLYIFDADREVLIRPVAQDGSVDSFFLNPLNDIDELPSGDLIIGGESAGAAIFDKKTRKTLWRQADSDAPEATDVLNKAILKILVDSRKRIWITSARGINLFDATTKQFLLFIPDPEHPDSKDDNALRAIAEDAAGNIIGGTMGGGLYIFNTQTHQFRRFRNDPKNPKSLPDNAAGEVMVASDGRIWIGFGRGVGLFDEKSETFTFFNYQFGEPGAPAFSATMSIYEDNNKNIWLGHYPSKVSFHDHSSEAISVYRKDSKNAAAISDNNVLAVVEDKKNNLWLSVGDGVNYFDRQAETFKHYNEKIGNYPARGTLSGYMDRQSALWIGSWMEGFYKFNPVTDRFDSMPANATLAHNNEKRSSELNDRIIWGFCERSDNSFWIGTHYAGISRYDKDNGTFTKYKNEGSANSLANNIAWTCHEDRKGRFWVGTADGLSLMDKYGETFKNYVHKEDDKHSLRSGSVLDIYEDKKGRLWFATNEGLHLYREASDDFEVFTTEDGFVNQTIRALTEDRLGNLWLGTNNGIVQFNPDTHKVKNYLFFAGKKGGAVNTGAALTNSIGEVMFGTIDGLIIIDADRLTSNQMQAPVVLTDFKVFAKSVSPDEPNSPLKKSLNNTDTIILDYTKRMFSFEFSLLNYRSAYKNNYAYMLEGFDQNWREIGNSRESQYTNLSPGKYVFKVRGANNDGVWTEAPKSIVVIQLPPPWKTWWAYIIYALLLAASIAYWVYLQKLKQRRVEEQNRLLEVKVAERTRDLAEKNKDIQTLLSNMRQGLFTVEGSGVIHHEYSTFLESIFESQSIAGRNVIELLFENALIDEDIASQVESTVYSIIGEDELNFDMNAHLLIREYKLNINDQIKILSLDWNPIFDARDNVIKLMVSVRDVTQLKALEAEAGIKKRELDIVSQLLPISSGKFNDFYRSADSYIRISVQLVEQADVFDKALIAKIFRTMHTIKGNSRTHGFSYIANTAHEAESLFDQLQSFTTEQAREKLLLAIETVAAVINEYNQVFTHVLMRNDHSVIHENGVWVTTEAIEGLKSTAHTISLVAPESSQSILSIINKSCSAPLSQVIASIVESLPVIAAELGKHVPKVVIQDAGVLIKESAQHLLQDVFTHVLTNAVDHGIEQGHIRVALNKDPFGTISINLSRTDHSLCIRIADDGGGLNLQRLYLKGLGAGLFVIDQPIYRRDVANSIFAAGVSTKLKLDTISGRGVGMDAVKQQVLEFGGEVFIDIEDADSVFAPTVQPNQVDFVLRLVLPADCSVI
jgi:ligand-binding sensor domain-containing protein/HPt (histidine-containing phosphotransfer) domain-containing protein